MIRICLAGATGWIGVPLTKALEAASDLQLCAAVARKAAGSTTAGGAPIYSSVEEALDAVEVDVLLDFTGPDVVFQHGMAALERGIHAVVGSSGLSEPDLVELDRVARERGVGVVTGSLSALLARVAYAASTIADQVTQWEIVEYGPATKSDAPSTTSQDVARRLAHSATSAPPPPIEDTIGSPAARGATVDGIQVHSVRLPCYSHTWFEIVLGTPYERVLVRYEPGTNLQPFVDGALIAARAVVKRVGLARGGLYTIVGDPASIAA